MSALLIAQIATKQRPTSLSTWFLEAHDRYLNGEPTLPTPPFQLAPHMRVRGDRFYEAIRSDVEAQKEYEEGNRTKPSPRYVTGALQRDLQRLIKSSEAIA